MFRAIREQVETIFREDPAAKSVLEIVLCYPGFHAILAHRLAHRLYGWGVPLLPRMISHIQPLSHGHRDPPGRDHRTPVLHRPRLGGGDRRNHRDRRRRAAVPGRNAGRHRQRARQAPSDDRQ